jgi:acyl-CoA reductase-like NAD-dependent aldehyde dehydrogenase
MMEYKEELEEQKVLIGEEWTTSGKGDTYTIINPSTGKSFVECQKCDVEDTKRAIDAARNAFDNGPWSEMSLGERTKIFYEVSDIVTEKAREIAKLDAMCNGIPISHHVAMMMVLPLHMKYVCKQAKMLIEPKKVPGYLPLDQTVWREPEGVVGIITSWNSPFGDAMMKLPPALINGNTVVFKPASQAPLTTLELGRMFERVGLPKGVLNI